MSVKQSKGFTLIEIVVGLVVIAIVTLVVTTGMGTLFRQTVDPWQQVRAAELGQSLMNEIMSRKFDENNTGTLRCFESTADCTNPSENESCPATGNTLPNIDSGETRSEFDDVDDFNCLGITETGLTNIFGNNIEPDFYRGFSAEIRVYSIPNNDNDNDNDNVNVNVIKQIDVVIVTPQNERIEFSAQRGNW
ncbi:UNVERIFIED_ORG: MSHA pilin protein MshD [Idiomarina abyssalis]|mgnify:CR=1 FL=1|uniref:type IV pilus modification PilV family protein n=1 Tax=Idiomarina sp. 017G TaxID=2183988 RepID=UPI000C390AAC|nr:type II secretion system protein [Idiomarina sp. 017G]MAA62867.1 pili assembly chaperone [Idiomarina sp.]TDO48790.1 MSHA pilin protein MshD [Idiomarina sp. 017G]